MIVLYLVYSIILIEEKNVTLFDFNDRVNHISISMVGNIWYIWGCLLYLGKI
jgi:hypothetical protein